MKAALFWVEIVCDECAKSHNGVFVRSRIPVRALTAKAIKDGWLLKSNGDWWCPKCTSEFVKSIHADKPEAADEGLV